MNKKYISMTKLSLLFSFSLLLICNLSKAQSNNDRTKDPNEQVFPWSQAQSQGLIKEEIVSRRNQFAKHFRMADGSIRMYSCVAPLHYKSGTNWKDVDPSIKVNIGRTHSSNPYFNEDNYFKTYYPENPLTGKIFTTLQEGEISESIDGMYAVDQNGYKVYEYQASTPSAVKIAGGRIAYHQIFNHASIEYTQRTAGRKFDVVLQSNQCLSTLPSNAKFLVIKEKMTIPSGWTISETANGIDIKKGATWIANLPIPMAYDNATMSSDEELTGSKGSMHMTKNGNEITLYTQFSLAWLKSNDRVFPIRLDPVVNYLPTIAFFNTGYITNVPGFTTPTSPKVSTLTNSKIRLNAGGSTAWAKFNISTLPATASLTSARFFGSHMNGLGQTVTALQKIVSIVGMQNVDPVPSDSFAIYNKIQFTGSIYNNNFLFGDSTALPIWRIGVLGGTALNDIVVQQAQGWTALGFKIAAGYLGAMLHWGIDGTAATYPYLELDYSTPAACAVAPVAGTSTASIANACALPFTLNLTGNTVDSGLTYQWQSSPAGLGTWTNIGSLQNSPQMSTTQSVASDYQCIVTCVGAALSSTSTLVSVGQNTINACYCTPSGNATSTYFITGVTTSGGSPNIINTSGNVYSTAATSAGSSIGYGNFTNLSVSAVPGSTIGMNISFSGGAQFIGVWVDWNQDGDFSDPGETMIRTVMSVTTSPFNAPATASIPNVSNSFVIPLTATPGNTRMRVRIVSLGTAQDCGYFPNSETEDYTFNVVGPCTSAGTASLVATPDTICPLTTKVMVGTVSAFQLGRTYQWMVSNTPGGPYTNVVGGTGANATTYTTPALPAGLYYYVLEATCANCGPCSVVSNEHIILSQDVVAPTGFNSAQCAPGVPTASVTSNNPVIGTGNFNWYATATATTPVQSRPYGPLQTCYYNDFSSAVLPTGTTIQTTASITGGVLQLHTPSVTNAYGGFQVQGCNYNSNKYQVDFDFSTVGTPGNMADGFSYSFSGNGLITNESTAINAENGTGGGLRLCFIAYPSGTSPQGIYIAYGAPSGTGGEVTPISTLGGLAAGYSTDTSWKNTANNHITLNIDSLGRVSVALNSVTIFNNLPLPTTAAYATANRSSWKHIWKGRTGGITMGTSIDNIHIQQANLATGSPTYLSSVATTTTFYVAELGANGCFSPRTPVTITVNAPPVLTINAIPNDSVCTGAPLTLSGGGASTYLWNGNATLANTDTIFTSAVAGTYTLTGTDTNGCVNTQTISVYAHPVLSGTASASPAAFCLGDSATLTAAAIPLCTGLYSTSFADYYGPSLWNFANVTTNGTLDTTGSPANVKISSGTAGSALGGITSFSRIITCTGNVTFNWTFLSPTDSYDDIPRYSINSGPINDFTTYSQALPAGTQTGSMTIPILAEGDTLHIYVETINNDASAGLLTITNFSAPSPKINGSVSIFNAPTSGTNLGTPPIVVTPSTSGPVTYYAEFTSSTTGCANPVRQPAVVEVYALPTATVSGGGTVCAGSTLPDVNITLTGVAPWTFTLYDGTTTSAVTTSANPYVIMAAAPGTYSVSNLADSNCTGSTSGSATVVVNTVPTATVNGGGSVCVGNVIPNVTIDLTGVSPWSITYTDGVTPVTISSITSSPYTIPGAVGVYSVTNVSDSTTCVGTSTGSIPVVLNPLPTVTASASSTNICNNSTVTLNGGGASTYVWSGGVSNGVPFAILANATYTVTGTDTNSCSSTDTISVNVNAASADISNATANNAASTPGMNTGNDNQPASSFVSYYTGNCNLIASIESTDSLGNTASIVHVEPSILTHNGQPYVARWFEITPAIDSAAKVIFYLTQDDFNDYNVYASANSWPLLPSGPLDATGIANLRLTKNAVTGLGNNPVVITPDTVIWNATTNYWAIELTVPSFSQFRMHAANPFGSALPANITSFTGQKEGNIDLLKWTTLSEQNNAYFNVQYSKDGINFVTIDKVISQAQGSNSSTTLNYQSIHASPSLGHNYYRLAQVDINQKSIINTQIVDLVRASSGSTIQIYPNPTQDILNVDLYSSNSSNTVVKIMDMSGRVVKQVQAKMLAGNNNLAISLDEITAGIYTIQIIENGRISFVERVRKD